MPLSCTNCRQRKVKCDRTAQCAQCAKASLHCQYPLPHPRVGKRKRDDEVDGPRLLLSTAQANLQRHKAHSSSENKSVDLENDCKGALTPQRRATKGNTSRLSDAGSAFLDKVNLNTEYESFVQKQDRTRYINKAFWNQLDESEPLPGHTSSSKKVDIHDLNSTRNQPASFIFGSGLPPSESETISEDQRAYLFDIFFARIHPVCRLLHKPTALSFLRGVKGLTDANTRRLKFGSLEAISCAINLAAVTSLTDSECNDRLGKSRQVLLGSLRRSAELELSACDLLNTRELVTLQAFTLYIVSMHSEEPTQSTWALLGLAVRISQALGVHQDGDGSRWDAFHAEMRRRLWWQLVALDVLMSTDRASTPLILDGSFSTRKPLNIDDLDIDHQSSSAVCDDRQITEMTLALTFIDGLNLLRSINSSPVSIQARSDLANAFSEKLELAFQNPLGDDRSKTDLNLKDDRTWLIYMSGQLLSLTMWLAVQYPLHCQVVTPHDIPRSHALKTALTLLSLKDRIEKEAHVAPFLWWFRMFEPWHALAVALSILKLEKPSALTREAWPVVQTAYERCAFRLSDEGQSEVWVPLQSLMSKARQTSPAMSTANQSQQPIEVQASSPNTPHAERSPAVPSFAALTSELFDWKDVPMDSVDIGNDSWEDWNQFVDDLSFSGQGYTAAMTDAWFM